MSNEFFMTIFYCFACLVVTILTNACFDFGKIQIYLIGFLMGIITPKIIKIWQWLTKER